MKKLLTLILSALMLFSLCACTGANSHAPDANAPAADAQPAPASDPAPASASLKLGFIFLHDENSTYDLNFISAAKEACELLDVEYVFKTGIPEGQECYDAAADLADQGCTLIFADSFGHEDYMIAAAREFPDVQFCHATGTKAHTEGLPNYHNAFAAIYEGRYLAGVAAGMKLNAMIDSGEFTADEAKIGYVGAFPFAEVKSGYTSFFLGARSVCPSATMEVLFTSSWYDETAEKEAAIKLIQDGCKLISQHADSMGAPTACENAGVPNVAYNGTTVSAAPNTYLIASRINWVPYFSYIINCMRSGTEIAVDWTGGVTDGAVELAPINYDVAAPNTEDAILRVMKQLQDGTLEVFDTSTWTVNGEQLAEYMADVDTDPAYEADTGVIFDGYFHESEMRSAPYFDITIDGITLLNG